MALVILASAPIPAGPDAGLLADQQFFETLVNIALKNGQFVITVFRQRFNFFTLNRQSTFIFVNAMTVKHTHFNNRAGCSGRQFQ
jgi:hypothetical protein